MMASLVSRRASQVPMYPSTSYSAHPAAQAMPQSKRLVHSTRWPGPTWTILPCRASCRSPCTCGMRWPPVQGPACAWKACCTQNPPCSQVHGSPSAPAPALSTTNRLPAGCQFRQGACTECMVSAGSLRTIQSCSTLACALPVLWHRPRNL